MEVATSYILDKYIGQSSLNPGGGEKFVKCEEGHRDTWFHKQIVYKVGS